MHLNLAANLSDLCPLNTSNPKLNEQKNIKNIVSLLLKMLFSTLNNSVEPYLYGLVDSVIVFQSSFILCNVFRSCSSLVALMLITSNLYKTHLSNNVWWRRQTSWNVYGTIWRDRDKKSNPSHLVVVVVERLCRWLLFFTHFYSK